MARPLGWDAYARLVVTVVGPCGPLEITPAALGVVEPWPVELPDPIHIMTPWDAGASRPGPEVNRRRQLELEVELRSSAIDLWPASGHDPVEDATDEGVAVAGLDLHDALAIARRYGQDALFEWTRQRWSIVSCRDEPRLNAGWSLIRGDPTT